MDCKVANWNATLYLEVAHVNEPQSKGQTSGQLELLDQF
jgi:hypothetical protein